MSKLVTGLGRSFVRVASRELNLYDRYVRFYRYWREVNKVGKCVDGDELLHHVDNLFVPILENVNQLAVVVSNEVPRYWRSRFTKALSTRDRGFVRWFLKNYVQSYTDVDAVVSQNNALLPCIFNYCFNICPAYGSSCVSGPTYMCFTGQDIGYIHPCCTNFALSSGGGAFDLVDNTPWISTFSSGLFGISGQAPSQSGVLTLTGNVTIPSCFPSGGIDLGLDFGVNYSTCVGGNCASSCPSDTNCCMGTARKCGSSLTYQEAFYPVLYYNLNYSFLPNSAYTVWWQASLQ